MSRWHLASLACTLAVLGGCGSSPPIHYYALSERTPTAAVAAAPVSVAAIRLQPLVLPTELDRLELVTHDGRNGVQIDELSRWASPLEDQVRRVLSDDLAARLPAGGIADPNEPTTNEPRRLLTIVLAPFQVGPDCRVTGQAHWTLRSAGSADQRGTESLQGEGTSCPQDAPAALSDALATLADRLASSLANAQ